MKNKVTMGSKALGLGGITGAVSVLALVASIAWAADGAGVLDVTFGAGKDDGTPAGVVSTSFGNGDDAAEDLIVGWTDPMLRSRMAGSSPTRDFYSRATGTSSAAVSAQARVIL